MSDEKEFKTPTADLLAASEGNSDPFGVAAAMFGTYSPIFHKKVDGLSTGQLRRLVKALVMYPLSPKTYIEYDNELMDTYLIGQNMLEAKFIMIMSTVTEHDEAQQSNEEGKENGET